MRPEQTELERAIARLGTDLDYPALPDVAAQVGARLRDEQRGRTGETGRRWWAWFPWRPELRPVLRPAWQPALALIVIVALAAGGLLAASPAARDAIAGLLGLRGIEITVVPTLSPETSAGPPGSGPIELDLGAPVTLDQAAAQVSYRILVPTDPLLAQPDAVFFSQSYPGGVVSLVYRARAGLPAASTTGLGLLITEFPGRVDGPILMQKVVGPGTAVEAVRVNGLVGFWISGRPHYVILKDASDEWVREEVRLAGDVLLWQVGDLTLRLESALPKDEVIRIAQSMR